MKAAELRETIGLIAVVASLGFVGYEVRQNTAAVESTAFQSLSELQHQATMQLTEDPGPALLVRVRQGAGPEDFSAEDNQRLRLMYFQHIDVLEAAYRQIQVGALDEDAMEVFWSGLLSLDYIREEWPSMRYSYTTEFADYFEQLLETIPPARAQRER